MTSLFSRFKSAPTDDPAGEINANSLRAIQENLFWWFAIFTAVLTTIALVATTFFLGGALPPAATFVTVVLVWLTVIPRLFPYTIRVVLLLGILSSVISFSLYINGLINGATTQLLVMVIIGSILLGRRLGTILLTLFTVLLFIVGWLTATGTIIPNTDITSQIITGSGWIRTAFISTIILVMITVIVYALLSNIQKLLQRQRALTQTIVESRNSLEDRVREQTRLLDLTVQLGRTLSTLVEPQQLIEEVVEQVQNAFGYYHVQIYLWNENQQQLQMAGGTGEAGRTLLIGKHKLPAGEGIVGLAAASQRPVLVPDVRQDTNWVPNTLLPETKTEAAIPIRFGDELLGVLDVQHSVVGRLQEQDVQILTTLANQVANALRNAEVYEQVQEQFKQQAIINELGQKIQLAPNITFTLQTAAQQLYQTLDANRLGITLLPKAVMPQEQKQEID